jgi:hypothetical protein
VTAAAAPRLVGPVRGGRDRPFDTSGLDLAALGYVEQEYFLSGLACAYRESATPGGDRRAEAARTAPCRTRILLRRPAQARLFNGTVVVEWLNVAAGMDASVGWGYLHTELIRGGYAWVGVSAQHAGITGSPQAGGSVPGGGLKGWDRERYQSLRHPGDDYSYDLFTLAGRALRSALPGWAADARLIATGSSQSAYRLTTYIDVVDPVARVYDGFLLHSRAAGAAPLRLPDRPRPLDVAALQPAPLRRDLRVPVLELSTETDLVTAGCWQIRRDDSSRFRLWEIAGAAHADTYLDAGSVDTGLLDPDRLARLLAPRHTVAGVVFDRLVNAAPQHHYVANAAVAALHRWVHHDTPPPAAPRLALTDDTPPRLRLDRHDNALGGIRTPWMDVPTATHSGVADGADPVGRLFGRTRPFPSATLARLYSSKAAYLSAFAESLDSAIAGGYLLAADAGEIRAVAAAGFG